MTPATRSRAKRRRARKRTTATRTIRWSAAEGGGIATGSDTARTPPHPRTMTYLQTMTPANTAVFRITPSWWVLPGRAFHQRVAVIDRLLSSLQILLCDSCDSGYHTACLRPPLMIIPDGEWFCPPCQHVRHCWCAECSPHATPNRNGLFVVTEAAVRQTARATAKPGRRVEEEGKGREKVGDGQRFTIPESLCSCYMLIRRIALVRLYLQERAIDLRWN